MSKSNTEAMDAGNHGAELIREARRVTAMRTFALDKAKREQWRFPNQGVKDIADVYFARLKAGVALDKLSMTGQPGLRKPR
jgi:hypothetical protein